MKNLRTQKEIISGWKQGIESPVVSICCTTYNHARYVVDALEGFLIQETDFPFEILIHDDASTDGTADVIKRYEVEYPQIIKSISQEENQYSRGVKPNLAFNFSRAKGEYIALCEGDDYWVSPEKLQIQVNRMRKNPDCSLSFHRSKIDQSYDLGVKEELTRNFGVEGVLDLKGLFFEGGSSASTASMLFRANILNEIPRFYEISPVGDMPLKLMCSMQGGIYYLPEIMSVRRLGVPGSWNIRTRLNKAAQFSYLNSMVAMLDEFDRYTDYAWSLEVQRELVVYTIKLNRLGLSPWVRVKDKYPLYWACLDLKGKLILTLRLIKARIGNPGK